MLKWQRDDWYFNKIMLRQSHFETWLDLARLLSRNIIIGPPIMAIIPLTIKVMLTNIPKNASPASIPILLSDSLIAVWFMFSTKCMASLAEISDGIDSAIPISANIDGIAINAATTRKIPPTIRTTKPLRIHSSLSWLYIGSSVDVDVFLFLWYIATRKVNDEIAE